MSDKLPTTGKYSDKPYRCTKCKKEKMIGTNHWGFTYGMCSCRNQEWECLESVPEGYGIPEKWRLVTLGDICSIKEVCHV